MMKGTVGRSVAAVMQESFGCAVANRFYQLLDDESDPFDILREAERRQQQRKKHDEAAAAGRAGPGGRAGGGRRETQKECRQPGSSAAPGRPSQPGQKQVPKRGEHQGFNNRGADVKQDKTEWRPSFREFRSYEIERQVELTVERPIERLDRERPIRGRGRGRGGMRGRGRGGGTQRNFDVFEQRGRRESERQSENEKIRMKADDKRGTSGVCNWGTVKNDTSFSGMEQTTPVEETAETAEQPGTSEGQPLNKVLATSVVFPTSIHKTSGVDPLLNIRVENMPDQKTDWFCLESKVLELAMRLSKYQNVLLKDGDGICSYYYQTGHKIAEGEPMEEVVQEMTLDEWKTLQQQNRPKPEFNIRKPESTVPSKAVVIHKSKYSDDLQKENFEDDSHIFRRPVNDITSQLDINFGSLPRPGLGSRGARGGRGRGRRVEETRARPEVVVHLVAPNPDDPEDFPALA